MAEPSIRVEVILAEIKSRVATLERDHERIVGANTRTIEKHEQTIEELEDLVGKIRLEQAVSNAEMQGMNKLKWIIVVAIATQVATTFYSAEKPLASTPIVRSK